MTQCTRGHRTAGVLATAAIPPAPYDAIVTHAFSASPSDSLHAALAPPGNEAALLVRLRAGDAAAFETLVREQGPRMLAVARRFFSTDEDAADAVQDAFLSAFKALPAFEGGSALGTWLHRITVNASLMRLRSRKRRPEVAIDDLLPRYQDDGHRIEPLAAFTPPEEPDLERRELAMRVREKIDLLPDDYRTVLVLRDIEGLDTDAAAEALEITPGAVKTRLHRARQALRTLLEAELSK